MAKHAPTRRYTPLQLQERAVKATVKHLSDKGYRVLRGDTDVRSEVRPEVVALKDGVLFGVVVRSAGKRSLDQGTVTAHLRTLRDLARSNAFGATKVASGLVAIVSNPQSLGATVEVHGSPTVEDLVAKTTEKSYKNASISYEGFASDEPDFDIDSKDATQVCPKCFTQRSASGACACID